MTGTIIRPDATVVLLAHEPGTREVETMELIRRQRYPGAILVNVIDSSPDPTGLFNRALREGADAWEAIPPHSFGHGSTRNRGLDACDTDVVVYLSQDAHPAGESWLSTLVEPLADGRAEASYGRQMSPEDDPEREGTYRFLYPEEAEIKTKGRIRELGLRTFHFSDVSSAFLTEILRTVRFPTDISTFEDVGIAKRLLDLGHRIAYVPQASVWHVHRLGVREMVKRYRDIGAIYERLGIFDELRRAGRGSLIAEGLRAARSVAPTAAASQERGSFGRLAAPSLVGGVKIAAVALGRWEARLGSIA
ncbi:MAG: glycosyltransferase family 2 protein [Actinomycetota bacterium]